MISNWNRLCYSAIPRACKPHPNPLCECFHAQAWEDRCAVLTLLFLRQAEEDAAILPKLLMSHEALTAHSALRTRPSPMKDYILLRAQQYDLFRGTVAASGCL